MDSINVRTGADTGYDIIFEEDYSGLPEAVSSLGFEGRRLCIISDSNVFPIYGEEAAAALRKVSDKVYSIVFPAGDTRVGDLVMCTVERATSATLIGKRV